MDQQSATATCCVNLGETKQCITAAHGANVLNLLHDADIHMSATCGGKGTCGQCRVVFSGQPPVPTAADLKHISPWELARGIRLACTAQVKEDCSLHLSQTSSDLKMRLQVEGSGEAFHVDPIVRFLNLALVPADHTDALADLDRLFQTLDREEGLRGLTADHHVVAQLSNSLRKQEWKITVCLRNKEMVASLPLSSPPVGLAVDLGTTKVCAYLMDLTTGKPLASAAMLNPQSRFGGDIMTRMLHANTPTGQAQLVKAIRGGINRLLKELCVLADIDPIQVVDGCIVANTAMAHLLLDLPTSQLSHAPYVPATLGPVDIKARELELEMAPGAYIHIPPGVGGFVGADHVAMIMAAGIDEGDGIAIGIDIGTNTEIVIRSADPPLFLCVSCPSGPAFEGAHISNGMKAAAGAIESVCITDKLEPLCKTIEDAPAIGLCGSGMIDALAEFHRHGIINSRGRLQGQNGSHRDNFCLVPSFESGTGKSICLTQQDINTLQLAKGAIRAGIETALDVAAIRHEAVTEVFIAGAFGSFVNISNAVGIGLLPVFSNAVHHQIGNAAALGAQKALMDRSARVRALGIAGKSRHIELKRHARFNRNFAEGMQFPASGRFL